jgi:hypothetical protein
MHKDLVSNFDYTTAIEPASYTSTQTSSAIDLRGEKEVLVIVDVGAITTGEAGKYFTFTVTEGATSAAADAVATTQYRVADSWDRILNDDDASEGGQVYAFQFIPTERYMKVVATATGSTPSAVFGVSVLTTGRHQPQSS